MDNQKGPLVSVLVPVRNEEQFILESLGSITSQNYPKNRLEIWVADGESTDLTPEIVEELARHDSSVNLINNPRKIMASGFNLALSHSQGEYILMLGGHTKLSQDYISQCVQALQSDLASCVGGVTRAVAENFQAQVISQAMNSRFGVGGVDFRVGVPEEKYTDTVAFGLYDRRIFETIGTLDEELVRNQDDEFNYRLLSNGHKILILPSIYADYYSRGSLRSLWRQYFQYGYWKVRVLQKHPRQMRLRQFIPPLFVFTLLLSFSFAFLFPFRKNFFLIVISAYICANLIASIFTGRNKNWKTLLFLPLTYAILHMSYGMGFLIGLIRFANRWGDKVGITPTLQKF